METTKVEVYRSGEMVAHATRGVTVKELAVEGLPAMTAIGMPKLKLERRALLEHLQGRPLAFFFQGSGVRLEGPDGTRAIEPMVYVHGRSRVLRGVPEVTAVVLAYFTEDGPPVTERELLPHLPKIYKEFSKTV